MKKSAVALAAFSVLASAMVFAAEKATVTGKVTDSFGRPLEHATVMVYHAGVKTGYSIFCPGCYTDCGKRTLTNTSGSFAISGLDADLWFELLIVHDGYTPTFLKKIDPLEGPAATVVLTARKSAGDSSRVVRGRVVDSRGNPVRDAVVTSQGILLPQGGETIYGTPAGLDPIAVTNEAGDFEIAYSDSALKMALMVEPRAMAPKFVVLPTGPERHTITVSGGAIVRGRLTENGKPVAGAEIGLNPRQSWFGRENLTISGSFYEEMRIGTQEDGTFTITGVPFPEKWYIYGKMESIASRGATNPVAVTTGHDGQAVNVGDVPINRGYRLRGKVVLSDQKSIPDGMTIFIASDFTRDAKTGPLAHDGTFEFLGLAAGNYSLGPAVRGYSPPKDKAEITASVDHDVDNFLIVLNPVGVAPAQR